MLKKAKVPEHLHRFGIVDIQWTGSTADKLFRENATALHNLAKQLKSEIDSLEDYVDYINVDRLNVFVSKIKVLQGEHQKLFESVVETLRDTRFFLAPDPTERFELTTSERTRLAQAKWEATERIRVAKENKEVNTPIVERNVARIKEQARIRKLKLDSIHIDPTKKHWESV